VGLILAIMATLWLSTRPSLTPQARLLRSQLGSSSLPARHTPKSLNNLPGNTLAPQSSESLPLPSKAHGSDGQLSKIETQPTVPDMTIYEKAEKIKTQRFYIVRQGDTLSAISQKSRSQFGTALQANGERFFMLTALK